MPANDFVNMQESALRHHIEPKQLRSVFPDFISPKLSGSSVVSTLGWRVETTPELNPSDHSVWMSGNNFCARGDVSHMQTSMNLQYCNKTKIKQDRWTNYEKSNFAVEKASSSMHKTGWGPIQYVFSYMLVKAVDNWLNTLWFFCILTDNTTMVSVLVKVWNVSVNFGVHINECFLVEYIYIRTALL